MRRYLKVSTQEFSKILDALKEHGFKSVKKYNIRTDIFCYWILNTTDKTLYEVNNMHEILNHNDVVDYNGAIKLMKEK